MEIIELKQYYQNVIESKGSFSGFYLPVSKVARMFPEIQKESTKYDGKERLGFLYRLINDMQEIPKCLCGKENSFESFASGYYRFCSRKCADDNNKNDPSFGAKISMKMKLKYNKNYFETKYQEEVISKQGENFEINCSLHGIYFINKNLYNRRTEKSIPTCEKCLSNYDFNEDENKDIETLNNLNDTQKTEIYLKTYHPKLFERINVKIGNSFSENKFMILNSINVIPICPVCNKNELKFIGSYKGYTKTCINTSCIKSSSEAERDIFKIISEKFPDSVNRFKIDSEELDIYVPELNLGIEYNGLYWHSENFRDRKWHQAKHLKIRNKGIKLFTVWEDDWNYKKEIVLSQINNLIGNSIRIYARKTEIKTVSYENSRNFLERNHLQGGRNDLIRIGLYSDDNLVSLMTFGKKKENEDHWELLRFCNLLNHNIVGGAGKLLKYFIENYKPKHIFSYANYDISDGNLYKKLGFKEEGLTEPGFWWCVENKKVNRLNFQKHKIAITEIEKTMTADKIMESRGYYKIWNSGNLKFTLDF